MNATSAQQLPLQPLDPEMRAAMLEELAELTRSIRRTEREKADSNKAFKEELDGFRDRMTKILARLEEDEQFTPNDRLRALVERVDAEGARLIARVFPEADREPGSDDDTGDAKTGDEPTTKRGRK